MPYTPAFTPWAPDSAWTPIPFWFWNDVLDRQEIRRQILDMKEKGLSAFVIHPRKGLPAGIGYMTETWLSFVRFAVECAKQNGMKVLLYDEGMYPSGSAHGAVVREDPENAARCLIMVRDGETAPAGQVIARCAVTLDGAGRLLSSRILLPGQASPEGSHEVRFVQCFSGGTIRGLHPGEDDGEPLAPPAADLLRPQAVEAFIRLTHEKYHAALRDFFPDTILGFFTDEPMITGRNGLPGGIAWTEGFLAELTDAGFDAAALPALFLEGEDAPAARRLYRRAVNARLNRVYYAPLRAFCDRVGVALTGHPALSWDLALEEHFTWPGQDVVWRQIAPGDGSALSSPDSVLAQCASDAALAAGRQRVLCECFGCCSPRETPWAFSFDDMKWYTDFLLVRGVNTLVPHAFFYSLREDRGSERPPDVGPASPWWPHYRLYAGYVKRLCGLIGTSQRKAEVAVLCAGDELDADAAAPLYRHQVPFRFLDVSLVEKATADASGLHAGGPAVRCVLVADPSLVNGAAAAVLERFRSLGGVVSADWKDALPFAPLRNGTPAPDLRLEWLTDGRNEYLLFTNEGETEIRASFVPAAAGPRAVMDPWQGVIRPLRDQEGPVALRLPRRESVVLSIGTQAAGSPKACLCPEEPPEAEDLRPMTLDWTFHLPDGGTKTVSSVDGTLPCWKDLDPSLPFYSGTLSCQAVLPLAKVPGRFILDLGQVFCQAEVSVNGGPVLVRLFGDFRFDLTPFLKPGPNTLTVTAANTPSNRLDHAPLPGGVLGPVRYELKE